MKPDRKARLKIRRERSERAFRFCGDFLKRLRNESGLTRGDLAVRLKQSPGFVTRIENGQRRLGVVEFMDYVQALGGNPSQAMRALVAEIPEVFGELEGENGR